MHFTTSKVVSVSYIYILPTQKGKLLIPCHEELIFYTSTSRQGVSRGKVTIHAQNIIKAQALLFLRNVTENTELTTSIWTPFKWFYMHNRSILFIVVSWCQCKTLSSVLFGLWCLWVKPLVLAQVNDITLSQVLCSLWRPVHQFSAFFKHVKGTSPHQF